MPTINRQKKKARDNIYHHKGWRNKDNESGKYYNTKWHNLRTSYLMRYPLCENCQKNNRITEATQVHHCKIILSGNTDAERYALTLDENNLMSVCNKCHHDMHKYARKHHLTFINYIKNDSYFE